MSAPPTENSLRIDNINSMKFEIFQNRCKRLAKRAAVVVSSIPKAYEEEARSKMEKLLLFTCLEDIELHLSRFRKKGWSRF